MGAIEQHTVHTTDRLAKLRALMKTTVWGLSSYQVKTNVRSRSYYRSPILITYQDSSEYIAHCDERRAYISGFNGSSTPEVTHLSRNCTLMKQDLPG
jgi:Xaa-Pro aminopeptidase